MTQGSSRACSVFKKWITRPYEVPRKALFQKRNFDGTLNQVFKSALLRSCMKGFRWFRGHDIMAIHCSSLIYSGFKK